MNKKDLKNTFSLQSISIELPEITPQYLNHNTQVFLLPKVQQEIYFATFEYSLPEAILAQLPHGLTIHKVIKEIIGKKTIKEDGQSLQNFFEQRGATFQTGTTSQSLFLRLSCLSQYWMECVLKLKEIIQLAALDVKTWKRTQKKLFLGISDRLYDSYSTSSEEIKKLVLGAHTLASAQLTIPGLKSLIPSDLIQGYDIIFNEAPLSIFIGGNWTHTDIDMLKKTFNHREKASLTITDSSWTPINDEFKAPKYNGAQFSLHWGLQTVAPTNVNYPIALMAAKALGGYFGSRLMQTLREEKGLTYGAYAYVLPYNNFSLFEISTDISQDQLHTTQEAIEEILHQLSNAPIPKEEWETVKNQMIGDLLSSLDGPIALMNRMRALVARGMNTKDFEDQAQHIQNMKAEAIQAFFQNHLKPSLFKKVWIG